MIEQEFLYRDGQVNFKGAVVAPSSQKRPAILVVHAWTGCDPFAKQKAKELAELGYVGIAIDLYGEGKVASSNEEAGQLMRPLFLNRPLLQKRLKAALDAAKELPFVDDTNIGVIGFCFGGLSAIELLRSGAPIKAAVSFHAVLGQKLGDAKAVTVPIAPHILGKLLVLHGHQDPLVPLEDLLALEEEMTSAKIDWQLVIYGGTVHAFTNPEVHDYNSGLCYNEKSCKRAWLAMTNFFEETFGH